MLDHPEPTGSLSACDMMYADNCNNKVLELYEQGEAQCSHAELLPLTLSSGICTTAASARRCTCSKDAFIYRFLKIRVAGCTKLCLLKIHLPWLHDTPEVGTEVPMLAFALPLLSSIGGGWKHCAQ